MVDQLGENETINNEPRPKFLKVLCILSYVSLGLMFLSHFFRLMTGNVSQETIDQKKVEYAKQVSQLRLLNWDSFADDVQKMIPMEDILGQSGFMYPLIIVISVLIGFFGVFKMWTGKKIGFHFYIIYSLAIAFGVYLFIGFNDVSKFYVFSNLFVSGIFVLMYSRNLNWMK